MLNSSSFPMQIFLSLEKARPILWTSNTNKPNHFFIVINNNWFFLLNNLLKLDILTQNTMLIEASAIDTLKYKKISNNFEVLTKNRILSFYSYYNYLLKLRLTVLIYKNNLQNENNSSVDSLFKNANWLEREFGEMYGVFFNLKSDTRKLLLDYTMSENPMLKDFSCESSTDIFYNIFEEKVCYIQNNIIEL